MTQSASDNLGIGHRRKLWESKSPRRWTLRTQLLLAVNGAMLLLMALFIAVDYYRERAFHLEEKRIALAEEANTLHQAVVRLRRDGRGAVQDYVDAVCGRMRDPASPGHHIAVEMNGDVIQALAHHRSSPEMLEAMKQASQSANYRARLGQQELIVGSYEQAGVAAYVSEYVGNVLQSLYRQMALRIIVVVVVALVVSAVLNLALLRIVARPVDRLVNTVRAIGAGEFGTKAGPFQCAELAFLATAVNAMSESLATEEKRRRAQLAKARRIQERLLPTTHVLPGITLASLFRPAEEVAGDFYDILELPGGCWLLGIGDVTGHGVPAAMTAAMLKALLTFGAERHMHPGEIMEFVNARLMAVALPEDLPSMFLARWNPEASRLEYASAGHEPAWLLRNGGPLIELAATGPLLALLDESAWKTEKLQVSPGDRLLLVTDGVAESRNPAKRQFGRPELKNLFSRGRDVGLEELVGRIDEAVTRHRGSLPPDDDVTVVAIEFTQIRAARQPSRPSLAARHDS